MSSKDRFHGSMDRKASTSVDELNYISPSDREFHYRFYNHFHPYTTELVSQLIERSVAGLQAYDTKYKENDDLPNGMPRPILYDDAFFQAYGPTELVEKHPVKELDFSYNGAYSVYNWELFYHVPLTIAIHLSKNQRFEESQQWFHYIFDPTDDSMGPTPARFWKVKPLQFTHVDLIEKIIKNLHTEEKDPELLEETISCISAWKRDPFRPHLVARYRQSAYMFKTVMAYLDNIIAWGDALFRQDTRESINEATQLYILAANILGPRPQAVPKKGSLRPRTYANFLADLNSNDPLGNIYGEIETGILGDFALPSAYSVQDGRLNILKSVGYTLYFCIPSNDRLLSYWDIVADRLFKVRNSLNYQGIFREIPLFEPKIDPALLARAAASGLDIGAILSGLNQPLPLVRFQFLVQKAAEICQEVKSLGNNLLSAIEKQENEHLSVLRSEHECKILDMSEKVKYAHCDEAKKNCEGLKISLINAFSNYAYYESLLGGPTSIQVLLEANLLLNFSDITNVKNIIELKKEIPNEPSLASRHIDVDIAEMNADAQRTTITESIPSGYKDAGKAISEVGKAVKTIGKIQSFAGGLGTNPLKYVIGKLTEKIGNSMNEAGNALSGDFQGWDAIDITGGKKINSQEYKELLLLEAAQYIKDSSAKMDIIGSTLNLIPDLAVHAMPLGVGAGISLGGKALGALFSMIAKAGSATSDRIHFEAEKAGKMGGYARREQNWALESNQAAGRINETYKQLRAAQIRIAVADWELEIHQQQIKHAKEIEQYLAEEKRTNEAFYAWMKGEVRGLYSQCFQLAFDIAKRAERALQHELDDTAQSFLQSSYLAGTEGLLAGERLYLDIKRMEMAYHELNQREYELTKHISLRQADPMALLQLRQTGRCTVYLPEELFDMDGPGHYFRRIRYVALSIPCVTGPYTSINCKLTLLNSSIRKSSHGIEYARRDLEDERFSDYYGSLQSIITSTGQNDCGLFESSLHDDRYLPFEGSGVISEWQLEMPSNPGMNEPCQFDYNTISDIIIHIRYTAREGGGLLRKGAMENLASCIEKAEAYGSVQLFSLKHEFAAEWTKFKSTNIKRDQAKIEICPKEEHYPYWSRGRVNAIKQIAFLAKPAKDTKSTICVTHKRQSSEAKCTLVTDASFGGLLAGMLKGINSPATNEILTFSFDDNSMDELWLALKWGK